MNDPYSERFALAHRPGNPLRTYTVPAGRRAIVRSFAYAGYLTTAPAVWLAIADHYIAVALPPAATFGAALDLYQVVYAGERITVDCTASGGDVWASVSGYLLTEVTGERVADAVGELEHASPLRQQLVHLGAGELL